jgi:hypothetical protein
MLGRSSAKTRPTVLGRRRASVRAIQRRFSIETRIQTLSGQRICQLGKAVVALRENLERVPMRLGHHVEHRRDERERDELVEEIAHGIDEHEPWPPPLEWLLEALGMKHHVLARIRRQPRSPTPAEAERERLGVAVGTPQAHFRAAVTGFHVASVHSIALRSAVPRPFPSSPGSERTGPLGGARAARPASGRAHAHAFSDDLEFGEGSC